LDRRQKAMGDGDIQKLRAALARRERGRGKRYSANLKQRIVEAAGVLRRRGQGWQTIGRFFGIPHQTVRRLAGGSTAPAFVPVEVVGTAIGGLLLVSPDGYRVEGLGAAEVAEILRRLR
jgi:hypothetical protein